MNLRKKGIVYLRSVIAIAAVAGLVALSACSSAKNENASTWEKNRIADEKLTADETYDRFVEGIGAEKTDCIIGSIGKSEFYLLTYGAGTSNIINLVNNIDDVQKLIALIGKESASAPTGLGAVRVLFLLNTIDLWMGSVTYTGNVPVNQDTIVRISDFVNGMSLEEITTKVVALLQEMNISRGMNTEGDQERLDKICKLIAHVQDVDQVIGLLSAMAPAEIQTRLKDLLLGSNDTEMMVEVLDSMTQMPRLIELIQTVGSVNRMAGVLNAMNNRCGSKLGYIVSNTAAASSIVYLIDSIGNPANLSSLINQMEDSTSWTGQNGTSQDWTGMPSGIYSGSASGVMRLVQIIDGLASGSNPAKLISILNGVSGQNPDNGLTKMMRLIQDVTNGSDIITLISSMSDCSNLAHIINNIELNIFFRLRQLVDGQRILGNTGSQTAYLGKMRDLISSLNNSVQGPGKVAQLISGVADVDKIIDLVNDVTNQVSMAGILNGINSSAAAAPNDTAVRTLIYMVENGQSASKLVSVINEVAPDNVKDLINKLGAGSRTADDNSADLDAAGKKLNNIIDGTTNIAQLTFLLNNVANFDNMAALLNGLQIASTAKVATLVNNLTGANSWNPAVPASATGIGKVVNLIERVTVLSAVSQLLDGVTDINKFSNLLNQLNNSTNIVGLINAVCPNVSASPEPLIGLMNGLNLANDIPKISRLLTDLNNTRDAMIAALLSPYSANATAGVGYQTMITLFQSISNSDLAATGRLATFMSNLSSALDYNGGTIGSTQAIVRILRAGGICYGQQFPGLGPVHVGVMMNNSTNAENLTSVVNGIGIEAVLTLIGCGEQVSDPGYEFLPACSAIGMGW